MAIMGQMKMKRYAVVAENTGCLVPCERTTFLLKKMLKYSNFDLKPQDAFKQNENSTVFAIGFHSPKIKYVFAV